MASQLLGWDHLEWWVGNARAVTAWLTSGFGFEVVAYAGPETGVADRVSYVLAQGDVRFVVTAGSGPTARCPAMSSATATASAIWPGGWRMLEATAMLRRREGATVVADPPASMRTHGSVTTAAIATYGETRHSSWSIRVAGGWGPGLRPTGCRRPAGDRSD